MPIDIDKLNKLAYANEERLRNARYEIETIKGCHSLRETLAKIAKENGFVRLFDNSFKNPISNQSPTHKAHSGERK